MDYREQGPCPAIPVFYLLNIDAQDAQDNQYETLRHERLAPAMIASGLTDVEESKPALSRKKILCILCIDVNQEFTDA